MDSLFQSETDQLQAVITLFRTQAAALDATIQNFRQVLALENAEVSPLFAEIDQAVLPQLQSFQQALNHTADEWSETLRRVQQVEPFLADLARRLETRVSASSQQIAEQSQQDMLTLLAKLRTGTKPAVEKQGKEDGNVTD